MTGSIWLVFSWLSTNPHSLNRSTSSIFDCLPFVAIITVICETCTVHNSNTIVHNIFFWTFNKIKPHAIWLFFTTPNISILPLTPDPLHKCHFYVTNSACSWFHILKLLFSVQCEQYPFNINWCNLYDIPNWWWEKYIMQSVIKSCVTGIYTYQ